MLFTFVINDSSQQNEYGFFVDNNGIDIAEFLLNPVALYEHETDEPSVGKWSNLRIEGTLYLADLEFDDQDEFALKLKRKYQQGYMRACSKTYIVDDYMMLDFNGSLVPIVTKCRLKEISLVNVPANAKSVLYNISEKQSFKTGETLQKGVTFKLSYYPKLDNKMEIQLFSEALGLPSNANPTQILEAIKKQDETIKKLAAEKKLLEEAINQEKVDRLINEAIKDKKLTLAESEGYKVLAKENYDTVATLLKNKTAYEPLNTSDGDEHNKQNTTPKVQSKHPEKFVGGKDPLAKVFDKLAEARKK